MPSLHEKSFTEGEFLQASFACGDVRKGRRHSHPTVPRPRNVPTIALNRHRPSPLILTIRLPFSGTIADSETVNTGCGRPVCTGAAGRSSGRAPPRRPHRRSASWNVQPWRWPAPAKSRLRTNEQRKALSRVAEGEPRGVGTWPAVCGGGRGRQAGLGALEGGGVPHGAARRARPGAAGTGPEAGAAEALAHRGAPPPARPLQDG